MHTTASATMTTWFMVIATGTVQAVYGQALRAKAIAKAKEVPMGSLWLASLNGRPRVGMRITPQTDWQLIET